MLVFRDRLGDQGEMLAFVHLPNTPFLKKKKQNKNLHRDLSFPIATIITENYIILSFAGESKCIPIYSLVLLVSN